MSISLVQEAGPCCLGGELQPACLFTCLLFCLFIFLLFDYLVLLFFLRQGSVCSLELTL